jgi:hypothetical protein
VYPSASVFVLLYGYRSARAAVRAGGRALAQVLQLVSIYLLQGNESANTDQAEGAGMELTSGNQMPRGTIYIGVQKYTFCCRKEGGTKVQILTQKAPAGSSRAANRCQRTL